MNVRLRCAFAILLTMGGQLTAQVSDPNVPKDLSLNDAMARVLAHNSALQAGELHVGMARADRRQAGLWPNPELSIETEGIGGSGAARRFDGAETTVTISQPIEVAGKAKKRQRVAATRIHQTEYEYAVQRRAVQAQTAKAFYAVLAAQEEVTLAQENLDAAQRLFQAVGQRVAAGKDSPIKETQAAIAVSERRLAEQNTKTALALARRNLAALWGSSAPAFRTVTGDFMEVVTPPTAEQVLNRIDKHPVSLRWQATLAEAEADLALAKTEAIPDITLTGGYKRYEDVGQDTIVLGLAFPLPLFNRNQGAKERATLALGRTRHLEQQAQVTLITLLGNCHQRLTAAAAQAQMLQDEILPRVEDAYGASVTAYREGKLGYLETLDAQRELFKTKQRVLEALTQYHETHADLEALTGPLTLGNNIPSGESS